MKIFVISLKRAKERRSYIVDHFSQLGVEYEIVDAEDYKEIDEEDFSIRVNLDAMAKNYCLTKGMASCSLSHVKVYDTIIKQNLSHALVVEDDVNLPQNISAILDEIEKVVCENEVIALSYYSHSGEALLLSKKNGALLGNGKSLLYPVNVADVASTMAYVVTKEVAKKLSEQLKPISYQPDDWGSFFSLNCFESLRCLYPVQVKAMMFDSTLGYSNTGNWKNKLTFVIKKYKIPILDQMLSKRNQLMTEKRHAIALSDRKPFQKGR